MFKGHPHKDWKNGTSLPSALPHTKQLAALDVAFLLPASLWGLEGFTLSTIFVSSFPQTHSPCKYGCLGFTLALVKPRLPFSILSQSGSLSGHPNCLPTHTLSFGPGWGLDKIVQVLLEGSRYAASGW